MQPKNRRQWSYKTIIPLALLAVLFLGGGTIFAITGGAGIIFNTTPADTDKAVQVSSLQAGLIGHWSFDGDAKDRTPYVNHGTVNGATLAADRLGWAGSAYSFDGVNSWIDLNTIDGNGPSKEFYDVDPGEAKTFSLWFKSPAPNAGGEDGTLFWKEGACIGWYLSLLQTGSLYFSFNTSDAAFGCDTFASTDIIDTSQNYHDDQWHHLAGVIDRPGQAMRLYVDGVLQDSASVDNTADGDGGDLRIGTLWNQTNFFNGSIDDVRIYNRALSADEIQSLHDHYRPIIQMSDLSKGLVAHWDMGGGFEAKDLTPYGNHGVLQNGPVLAGDRFGIAGEAYSFDGSNDINIDNSSTLQVTGNQTISMWIKPTDFSARRNLICKAYGGEFCITLEVGQVMNYYYGTSGANADPYQGLNMGFTISSGEWTHSVVVRDLDSMKLRWYINGSLLEEADALYGAAAASPNPVTIGSGYVENYIGSLDDVRLYNRALSTAEVQALYELR